MSSDAGEDGCKKIPEPELVETDDDEETSTSNSDGMPATNNEESHDAPVDAIVEMVSTGAMSTAVAGKMLKPIQTKDRKKQLRMMNLLKKRWPSRQHAIDSIKLHSTKQGKRVLVNRKASNGKRVVMMCASSLSPAGKPTVSESKCNYRIVLRMSKRKGVAKPWAIKINTQLKDLQHCAMCTSEGRITYRELKRHVKSTNSGTVPSIKEARDRIARDNKIPQSYVSQHVAVRARLEVARRTRRTKKTSVTLKPNELRGLLSIVEGENASIVCKMLSIKVCFLEPETFTY